ncbi:MAG: hypothetical protein L6R40_003819 [Gallowayella cf. fulva]|nr:MAG: hypothetical protein L6R40_003819 [Xanthomendoza cf. fulva]
MIPTSIFLLASLLHSSLSAYALAPRPPSSSSSSLSQHPPSSHNPLTLPPPPDPVVLHRTSSSFPPTTIAIKFHSYGDRNNFLQVRDLLDFALVKAYVETAHDAVPRDRPLHYPSEDRSLELDFNAAVGVTWGDWRIVLDAMKEFIKWYESCDFLFEVRIFERGKAGRGAGAGLLWTGLTKGRANVLGGSTRRAMES